MTPDPGATPPRPRRLRPLALPAAVAAGLTLYLYLPLLDPRQVLVARDVFFLHLPLRTTFAALARFGLPDWNPTLHGGQPLLSNPQYTAFYPPTWLGLVTTPSHALGLLVPLHFLIAFFGARALARELGCARRTALLAAVSFAAGGGFIHLIGLFNLLCGLAWLPWALYGAERALTARGRRWIRPAIGTAVALGLQILSEGQVAPLVTVAMLGLLGLARLARRPWLASRLVAAGIVAGLLAAVQVVPFAARIPDSPRARPLSWKIATTWSMPVERLPEIVLPRLYGDPSQDEANLHFGWKLNDRSFPFVISLYQGMTPALLGLAVLALAVPRRWAWAGLMAIGVALALGRHDPIYRFLWTHVPPFDQIRYPEKFLLLLVYALTFAGVLGWDRVLRGAVAWRRRRWPVLLALLVVTANLALLVYFATEPASLRTLLRGHSGMPPTPKAIATAIDFLRREAAIGAVFASWTAALLLAAGPPRRRRWLAAAATALVTVELLHYGAESYRVLPAHDILEPPELVRAVLAAPGRVFTDVALGPRKHDVSLRLGPPGYYQLRTRVYRLDPYSAATWGVEYALHEDFDLMLTGWGSFALRTMHGIRREPDLLRRYLGAWNVATLVRQRGGDEMLAEARRLGRWVPAARLEANPHLLPRFRAVTRATLHPDRDRALAAARRDRFDLAHREHLVVEGLPAGGATIRHFAPAALAPPGDYGDRIVLGYDAPGPALLVAAITFDRRWTAAVDGAAAPLLPTAAGQMALAVPAGAHLVVLEAHDPWVRVGGAITLATLLALALILRRTTASSPATAPANARL